MEGENKIGVRPRSILSPSFRSQHCEYCPSFNKRIKAGTEQSISCKNDEKGRVLERKKKGKKVKKCPLGNQVSLQITLMASLAVKC